MFGVEESEYRTPRGKKKRLTNKKKKQRRDCWEIQKLKAYMEKRDVSKKTKIGVNRKVSRE